MVEVCDNRTSLVDGDEIKSNVASDISSNSNKEYEGSKRKRAPVKSSKEKAIDEKEGAPNKVRRSVRGNKLT